MERESVSACPAVGDNLRLRFSSQVPWSRFLSAFWIVSEWSSTDRRAGIRRPTQKRKVKLNWRKGAHSRGRETFSPFFLLLIFLSCIAFTGSLKLETEVHERGERRVCRLGFGGSGGGIEPWTTDSVVARIRTTRIIKWRSEWTQGTWTRRFTAFMGK